MDIIFLTSVKTLFRSIFNELILFFNIRDLYHIKNRIKKSNLGLDQKTELYGIFDKLNVLVQSIFWCVCPSIRSCLQLRTILLMFWRIHAHSAPAQVRRYIMNSRIKTRLKPSYKWLKHASGSMEWIQRNQNWIWTASSENSVSTEWTNLFSLITNCNGFVTHSKRTKGKKILDTAGSNAFLNQCRGVLKKYNISGMRL